MRKSGFKTFVLAAGAAAISIPLATSAAQAAGRQVTVQIGNMRYGQIPSDLKVGDTIVWQNRDSVPHTVTARDKSFDLRLNPHQSAQMTLGKAGSIPFYCIFHAQMRGTLSVGK
jgi:plastocyanin